MDIYTILKKLSIATAGAAMLTLGAAGLTPAQAELITFEFQGDNFEATGEDFFGSLTYDTEVAPDQFGNFPDVVTEFSVTVNGIQLAQGVPAFGSEFGNDGPYFDIFLDASRQFQVAYNVFLGFVAQDVLPTADEVDTSLANGAVSFGVNDINYTPISGGVVESVPEPTSMLSLLTLGALGVSSAVKRKQQQKATFKV